MLLRSSLTDRGRVDINYKTPCGLLSMGFIYPYGINERDGHRTRHLETDWGFNPAPLSSLNKFSTRRSCSKLQRAEETVLTRAIHTKPKPLGVTHRSPSLPKNRRTAIADGIPPVRRPAE